MMNLRILISTLTVAAFAVLWACASIASATVITSNGSAYTGTIKAEAEGSVTLHGVATVTCGKSTAEGKVESQGSSVTAEGAISTLTFSECNNHVTVVAKGSLIAHATSEGNGTLTSSEANVTVQITSLGVSCVYSTSATHIGTITGSIATNGNATLDINSASIPRTAGDSGIFCGGSAGLTGTYKVTSPSLLVVATEVNEEPHLIIKPDPIEFKNETIKTITIENQGNVTLEQLYVGVVGGVEEDFGVEGDCIGLTFKKGGSCTEEVKCLTVGEEGALIASSFTNGVWYPYIASMVCKE